MKFPRLFQLFISALLFSLISGCVLHRTTPFEPGAQSANAPIGHSVAFRYQRQPISVNNHMRHDLESPAYRVRELTFPSAGNNGQVDNRVSVRYFQSKGSGEKPLVIILPIWGTYTYPPEKLTRSILKATDGTWHVMWVLGADYLLDWDAMASAASEDEFDRQLSTMADRVATAVIDVRRLVDWTETRPEIEPENLAVVGFSVSSLVASLTLAHESRLDAGVLVMGGALPAEIFATCPKRPRRVREATMKRFGWSLAEYRRVFEQAFETIDPARYTDHYSASNILMIDARHDRCVPEPSREALWSALGHPERLTLGYGHKLSFLAMSPLGFNFLNRRIIQFLDRRFQ
jgi:dienelactone hydrolase